MIRHLDDAQIQGLADGTLRGPEGMSAREHCDACELCGPELAVYSRLAQRLSLLEDPPVPADFTAQVLAAVDARALAQEQRRHTLFAAIPAALLALAAIFGWAFSIEPAAHVD